MASLFLSDNFCANTLKLHAGMSYMYIVGIHSFRTVQSAEDFSKLNLHLVFCCLHLLFFTAHMLASCYSSKVELHFPFN